MTTIEEQLDIYRYHIYTIDGNNMIGVLTFKKWYLMGDFIYMIIKLLTLIISYVETRYDFYSPTTSSLCNSSIKRVWYGNWRMIGIMHVITLLYSTRICILHYPTAKGWYEHKLAFNKSTSISRTYLNKIIRNFISSSLLVPLISSFFSLAAVDNLCITLLYSTCIRICISHYPSLPSVGDLVPA